MFEQAFKNIDDVLWKDAGCTSELDYTEQTSWLLFLKYLDALEHEKQMEAQLDGKKYVHIIDEPYRWESWAAPKDKDGKIDHNTAQSGDDLLAFVNQKLFPYLHAFKQKATGPVWKEEFPIYFQKAIHRVRFHQPELSHWFVYYLYHCDSTGTLRQHFTGSGIQHFTGQTLARFTVPVSPLPAIKQLIARFHSVREETQRLATIYERKLAALDDLKKSLLHQAFSGQL